MRLIEKVKTMLGFSTKAKTDYIGPDISKAVQRNEMAGERARRVLETIKMTDTMRDIVGKM